MMEELLRQLEISPVLPEEEMQRALEKLEVDLSRKISVVRDSAKRKELEKQLNLVGDALIILQDKRAAHRLEEVKARAESGLQEYKEVRTREEGQEHKEEQGDRHAQEKTEAVPVFPAERIYREYEKAVTGKDIDMQKCLYAEVSREAEKGNDKAMNLLALLYYLENEDSHTVKSARLLMEAAAQNNAAAYSNLSLMHKKGVVVEQDSAKAKEYLVRASEFGNLNASRRLAEYYENSNNEYNIPKDWGKAGAYYKRVLDGMDEDLSDYDYRLCLYKYVKCGWSNHYRDKNISREMSLLLQPLLRNEGKFTQEARLLLGEVYVREEKYTKAVELYLKAGSDGVKWIINIFPKMPADEKRDKLDIMLENMAMEETKYTKSLRGEIYNWYGERCRKGIAKDRDEVKAWKYYDKAIQLGFKDAEKNKALLLDGYLEGDNFEAIVFFQEAAKKGVADAYRYLGDMYAVGRGCGRDYEKAMECYIHAKNGTMSAYCERKAQEMLRFEKCRQYFEQASSAFRTENFMEAIAKLENLATEDKYPDAMFFIAELNEKSNLHYNRGQKDPVKALRYYKYAAEAGHRNAQRKMVEIYHNGLLGVRIDHKQATYWEERLRK